MKSTDSNQEVRHSIQSALRVLEVFSTAAEIAFDRILATRTVGEASQAIRGEGAQTWASRLVEVGESVNLRIRSVECTLDEALSFVRQRVPVALCVERTPTDSLGSDNSPGSLHWFVLMEAKGRKIRVAPLSQACRSCGCRCDVCAKLWA